MLSCGFLPIFSEVSGPIWFAIVGKSSEGVAEGQVCKNFLIGQEIRKLQFWGSPVDVAAREGHSMLASCKLKLARWRCCHRCGGIAVGHAALQVETCIKRELDLNHGLPGSLLARAWYCRNAAHLLNLTFLPAASACRSMSYISSFSPPPSPSFKKVIYR